MKLLLHFTWILLLLLPLFGWSQAASTERNFGFLDLCWSPDGKAIYYSYIEVKKDWSDYDAKKWKIGRVWIDSGKSETLLAQAYHVSASPDGKSLLYISVKDENQDLYLLNLTSLKSKRLTHTPTKESASCWSPDGKWIAYNKEENNALEIFTMQKNGKHNRQLTHSGGYKAYTPDWSPDGKSLVYYLEKGDRKDQIHIIDADGKNDRNISQDTLLNFYPGWTTDGNILYTTMRNNNAAHLRTINPNSLQKLDVLQNINAFFSRQSPDGKQIAFLIGEPESGIFLISAEGGEPRKLLSKDNIAE